jgi:hypothetical protein
MIEPNIRGAQTELTAMLLDVLNEAGLVLMKGKRDAGRVALF